MQCVVKKLLEHSFGFTVRVVRVKVFVVLHFLFYVQ